MTKHRELSIDELGTVSGGDKIGGPQPSFSPPEKPNKPPKPINIEETATSVISKRL